ncbi:MAG: DegT/DnrJ/EryC1/StrS family aminotransferase [Bifidobacteriaceae bacterium]|jgi:dTDP-4-amino-4,6-dideoxygalactose transaminase|nr:DegT/DnrJ/EryC1/StrS family aminotransferase [Bifidobacteriaceae bacterium]
MTVPLGQPTVGEEELEAVREVFASGWLSGAGPTSRAFESELADAAGTAHALATSNCGSALHLAVKVLGAGPGDEVIVADYTFPATGHAVAWTGARPVFADIRPDIWSVAPDSVESLISPRTAGIIAVDVAGQPADYEELGAVAARHGLWLIEDAACSSGATYNGRPAGSLADIATFSFHGRKVITAGEGGALLTDNAAWDDRARKLHTYGTEPALGREGASALPIPTFGEVGHNYRMSDVLAAIMRVQLRKLPALVAARARAAASYRQLLGDVEEIVLPVELPDRAHAWQTYIATMAVGIDRDAVAMALRRDGIGCTFGTYASHLQGVYGHTDACPVSADVLTRHLAIPMHANLTETQIEQVAGAVRRAVRDPANRT